ncbi:hypothetical protein Spith_2223 [Spirochaeta thermophila DSM 6578]|uniref:Uncharacterized protein n=1 Tax=Winmispira thermophila (strain ATCC 700085 / DSM 6578 / Z-1203) TaxID=869211 RepID=G0GG02_WINT7|nr:hypothetical protein [Spirochaeta thermophila]AEJ62478.1 hypothetical protein Spith_2223 [Spirochaeta thermophila DSM 6578]
MTETTRARELFTSSLPSVLVPYRGPSENPEEQDIFLYLRPESNGVVVESTALKVITSTPDYKKKLHLVYMANIPGEFISSRHIVEQHYRVKLIFATYGKRVFTPYMRQRFSAHFGIPFDEAHIVGAFEALRELHMSPEELFQLWVPEQDVLTVLEQTIKRYNDLFIVNYDIPALLHKNTRNTDIAVMLFRTSYTYDQLALLFKKVQERLQGAGLLKQGMPLSRVIHFSKSPFEQILDAQGYLYAEKDRPVPLEEISFARYLLRHGFEEKEIRGLISYPLVQYEEGGRLCEGNVFTLSHGGSYRQALDVCERIRAQFWIH